MSKSIRRVRRYLAAATVLAVPMAVLPAGVARAATESDLYAYIAYDASGQAATGTTVDLGFVAGDQGPGDASNVTVQFSATGGTISSVAVNHDGSTTSASCTNLTCTIPSLSYDSADFTGDSVMFDVLMARQTDGTAAVTETVTPGSGVTDPDTSNNSFEDDTQFTTPTPSTITNVSAMPDSDEDGVTVTATLRVGGDPYDGEEMDVWAKKQGADDSTYVKLVAASESGDDGVHTGVAHIDVESYYDADGTDASSMLQGPVTLKVEHPADPYAGESAATVDVTPRPVSLSLSVPRSVTYAPGQYVTLKGTAVVSGDDPARPAIPLEGLLVVESRPVGSSAPWKQWRDQIAPGRFTTALPATVNTDFRLRYISEGPGSGAEPSTPQRTDVKQRVKTVASPQILPPHSKTTLNVTVGPTDAGAQVVLQKRAGSKWRTFRHGTLSSHSTVAWPLKFTKVSTASYRVVTSGTSHNTANTGPATPVIVERHAGGSPSQHTFLYKTGLGDARWNPCKPIPYWFNAREAPAGGVDAAKEALRRISQITRLHFVAKGSTHEVPQFGRKQRHKLVIAWLRPGQTNYPIGNGTVGVGGGEAFGHTAKDIQVISGYAVLDSTERLTPGFGAGVTEGELLLHELGHMTGLDHVDATSQIMYPDIVQRPAAMYGAGDYRGLQLLGRSQGCIAKYHPPRRTHARAGAPPPVTDVFAR